MLTRLIELRPTRMLTKNSQPRNVGDAKVLGTHLHVAKVNILIVEVGTLCQPGEVTSGERQPELKKKKKHGATSPISIQHSQERAEPERD